MEIINQKNKNRQRIDADKRIMIEDIILMKEQRFTDLELSGSKKRNI